MINKAVQTVQGATDSGPKPGDFPLGSELSRAAARAMLSARDDKPTELQIVFVEAEDGRATGKISGEFSLRLSA
jgi:hypothetical protein